MNLKQGLAAIAVVGVATAASIGVTQLQASQNPLLTYCPAHAGGSCAEAVQMYLQFAHPTDAQIVTVLNTLAASLDKGRHSRRVYQDALQALGFLTNAIDDRGLKAAAKTLVADVAAKAPGSASTAATPSTSFDIFGKGADTGAGSPSGSGSGGAILPGNRCKSCRSRSTRPPKSPRVDRDRNRGR